MTINLLVVSAVLGTASVAATVPLAQSTGQPKTVLASQVQDQLCVNHGPLYILNREYVGGGKVCLPWVPPADTA